IDSRGTATLLRGPGLATLERLDSPAPPDSRPRTAAIGGTIVTVNPYPGFPIPMLVSTNYGASFVPPRLPPGLPALRAIHAAEDGFLASGEQGIILRSADGL